MPDNIIILTAGGSGSSVLTGLISRGGYWPGHETEKVAFETFENSTLVNLNRKLLEVSGFGWHDVGEIPPPSVTRLDELAREIDLDEYRALIDQCNQHAPWVWKDPRLCYTMYFWRHLLNVGQCKFILARRDVRQIFSGDVLRTKYRIEFHHVVTQVDNCIHAAERVLGEMGAEYLTTSFEHLIVEPESAIDSLNGFLGTTLTVNDLKNVYKGKLYRRRWTRWDYLHARARMAFFKHVTRKVVTFPLSENSANPNPSSPTS